MEGADGEMIKCAIADLHRIEISANDFYVDIYCTDEYDNKAVIEMSRDGAELLLKKLLESLNKLERRP